MIEEEKIGWMERRGDERIGEERERGERREVRWGRSRPGVEIAESGC